MTICDEAEVLEKKKTLWQAGGVASMKGREANDHGPASRSFQ